MRLLASLFVAAVVGCSSSLGESTEWQRPCGTAAERQVDREACLGEAAGLVDPSGPGSEYARDLFRQCMQSRGWQRLPAGSVPACN